MAQKLGTLPRAGRGDRFQTCGQPIIDFKKDLFHILKYILVSRELLLLSGRMKTAASADRLREDELHLVREEAGGLRYCQS
jgi:hypothetical protein